MTTLSSDCGATELPDKWPAIIVDIDGTIARHVARHWSEYEKCRTDEVIEEARAVVKAFAAQGYAVVMLTGRPTQYRTHTIDWLAANDIHFDALFMRSPRDMSSNAVYKEHAYRTWLEPKYDVLFALEDNPHVVKMFRGIGVSVLDVGSHFGGA